ncbi:DUF4198 domain-containing protein [Terasakiella sp. SH-1]|uniref:DUF4198 domain-containing protein n=1 Tax=Terasakiella sp. SH-1 TaxID=2560057 RepID=UPI00107498B7|nr:DUF4198 domain-containing protein [Terasakiella sp. SH-1]
MKKFFLGVALAVSTFLATDVHAHFQLVYSPQSNTEKAGVKPLKLLFWHPMENGHVMDMGQPEEFYYSFKGKKTDLTPSLKAVSFNGLHNKANAYDGAVKLKRNGDYKLILTPAPYYEESEDIYIQQITQTLINKGGVPTDWAEPLGLKTEILPLNKPYGAVVGSSFSAIVLREGKPLPGVEVEIEHMVAEPDMVQNKPSNTKSSSIPGGALSVISDANGKFTFAIPKAGYWGFAALGSGPDQEYQGKELSQDAVLWIKAHELGE